MKIYLLSLGAGLLVGVIYGLINVRSPAPPVVALVGLLGILVGEQVPPLLKGLWSREPAGHSWHRQVRPHVFGHLSRRGRTPQPLRRAGARLMKEPAMPPRRSCAMPASRRSTAATRSPAPPRSGTAVSSRSATRPR